MGYYDNASRFRVTLKIEEPDGYSQITTWVYAKNSWHAVAIATLKLEPSKVIKVTDADASLVDDSDG